MLNFKSIEDADVHTQPFRFLQAAGAVTQDQAADVRKDYPGINRPGFFPLASLDARGAFAELIEDLQSDRLAAVLGQHLDLDLVSKPRMITVRKLSQKSDGRIHNDSQSKICTMLIYLNEKWSSSEGAVRALNGDADMDDFALEVAPTAGNVFAFARSDNSWHGHPPFAGDRYVVQTTYLVSDEALRRKEKTGGWQQILKNVNPFAKNA
ncbi:MAG: 2OG-Fe(II) oxygenase [Pseudomonadota bacterium]